MAHYDARVGDYSKVNALNLERAVKALEVIAEELVKMNTRN